MAHQSQIGNHIKMIASYKKDEFSTLAMNVKKLRKVKYMSQEELAYQSKIDRTFVSKIERGIANPSLKTLIALSNALGVTLVELFIVNKL